MDEALIDVFFYGLFMDPELLIGKGITPRRPRHAIAESYGLRIGQRATLVPGSGERAYGMIYALTRGELDRLYAQLGLEDYRPAPISVRTFDGSTLTAMCYNLAAAPRPGDANAEYAARLKEVLNRLGFPAEYAAGIGGSATG
jgi:hypothetical protein